METAVNKAGLRFAAQVPVKATAHAAAQIVAAPLPEPVLDKCYADVSLLVGMMVDKFAYHLPLYRIHQRMKKVGIELAWHLDHVGAPQH